jgi:UDP-4-amino-4,6-dideoxy-N-acetyl-beta-L-altrosamine transaminase
MIHYARQDIDQADIDAVIAVLNSDFLTQGPSVPAFEKAIENYCGVQHAIAVNSATSALHIACLALGVGQGDIVWTTSITFVASANCALYCGATVDFVDIDPQTYNMSIESLAEKLAAAEKVGKLPKVLIPVHLCGQPCDMVSIYKLGQKYGFKIIEDASHAIGGKYKNEPIGNGRYSDITVFSFHPVKIITTGEGGMAVTKDNTLAKHLRLLRSHGISSAAVDKELRPPEEIWNYQQIGLGFNYRMTDMQAALGVSQMKRLDVFVSKRHDIALRYDRLLSELPILIPFQHKEGYSGFHLYVIRLKLTEINKTQRQVYDELHAAGILVNLHYIPVYRHPYYEKLGFTAGYCPQAERYFTEAISLPLYPALTEAQQDRVIAVLRTALAA